MAIRIARPVLLNTWVNASLIKARAARAREGLHRSSTWDDILAWLDQHAAGRSLVDVGGIWGDHWGAFDAEERGARSVTLLDVTPPTEACLAEQERRGTHVRFVTGDLHDVNVLEEVGAHDITLCSGVLYHSPNPCLTLERLRSITTSYLVLGTQAVQEVPGIPQACIFYPCLTEAQRLAFAAHIPGIANGLTTSFDPALDYSNWWWGFSRSALRAMLQATGWEMLETKTYHAGAGYAVLVIARPIPTVPIEVAGMATTAS
jgi:hypothetical protein